MEQDPGSRCDIRKTITGVQNAGDGADIKNYVFEVELEGVTTTFGETTAVALQEMVNFLRQEQILI